MEKNIIIVDNYDSFTHLIQYYLKQLAAHVCIIKNDDSCLKNMEALSPTHLVLSPGPGNPDDAGFTLDVIGQYYKTYPMLGLCLGHQSIAQFFGAHIVRGTEIMHGKCSLMSHTEQGLFEGFPCEFKAMRYHSFVIDPDTLPDECAVTAWTHDKYGHKVMMGFQHRDYPVFGIQYHPEAVLTECGNAIFENFLRI